MTKGVKLSEQNNCRVVIFLDVDGVLNSHRSAIAYGGFRDKDLDPVAIKLLDRLARKLIEAGFRPEVVISSTWRLMRPQLRWWEDLFDHHGCVALRVVGITPEFGDNEPQRRGREVAAWMEQFGGGAPYVCLDDDSDFLPGQPLVLTNHLHGLEVEHIAEAFRLVVGREMFDPPLPARKWALIRALTNKAPAGPLQPQGSRP